MSSLEGRDAAHRATRTLGGSLRREWQDVRAAWAEPATRRGMLATTLILVGSFSPASLPNSNPFRSVPVLGSLQYWPGRGIATAVLLVGVVLLLDAWLRMRPSALHRPTTRATLWLWSLPLLAAPPLLSFDAYSYAAQGYMVHRGFDPYSFGPAVLDGVYQEQVDQYWQYTPAPYGPLSLQLQHLLVDLSGFNAYLSAILMRVPALVGVVLIAVYLPRLARRLGYDREGTIWLAVLNPLVVLHFVGGAHNDSLMMGLMILGLWLAVRRHLVWGALAVAAAATIKQPAAAAILAVAALHARRVRGQEPTNAEVGRAAVPAIGVFLLGFVGITVATGLGFGWVRAAGVPGMIRSMLAPFTAVGSGLEWLFNAVGWTDTAGASVPFLQKVGMVVGAVASLWLIWRFKARRPVRTLGWVLLVFVVTGAVVHPWYLLWGGLILAMTEATPVRRRVVLWASAGLVLYSAFDAAWFLNSVSALSVTLLLALVWVVTGHDKGLDRDVDLARGPDHRRGVGRR
ncbi:MAG: polyprenol phosphomannose-dependent alpha 1,6 mannosyltransferase MptB [Dermatophilaceae bacterium]